MLTVYIAVQLLKSASEQQFTYLSDPEWLELPWQGNPKKLRDKLLDVFAEGVNMIAEAEKLGELRDTGFLEAAVQISHRCWKVDAKLQEIYADLERSTLGPLYWPEFSTINNPADEPHLGRLFPVAFQFLNLKTAATCILYWTLCIITWSAMNKLYPAIYYVNESIRTASSGDSTCNGASLQSFDARQLPPLEHRADIMEMIRNVCQAVEFCMQEEMGNVGPKNIIFPVQVVIENLLGRPKYTRELVWAKAALEMIQERGFRIARYVTPTS